MSTALGPFTVGPDYTTILLQPNSGSGSTLTPGSSYNVTAVCLSVRPRLQRPTQNIKPSTTVQQNMIPIETGSGLSMTLLQTSDATGTALGQMLNSSNAIYVTLIKTLISGTETDAGWYTLTGVTPGMEGVGQQTLECTFEPRAVVGGSRTFGGTTVI